MYIEWCAQTNEGQRYDVEDVIRGHSIIMVIRQ